MGMPARAAGALLGASLPPLGFKILKNNNNDNNNTKENIKHK